MKNVAYLILCIVLTLSLVACGSETTDANKHSIDVEYYADLGQINDFGPKLGDNVEDTKTTLSATLDDHGESIYFDFESGDYTIMTDGNAYCCYKTADASAGLTHIVKTDGAFGFNVGAVSTQIRDAMSTLGFTATERDAKSGELFFLPAGANSTVLEYNFENSSVLFVFQNHYLAATVVLK